MINFNPAKQAHRNGAAGRDGQSKTWTISQSQLAEYQELKAKAERFKWLDSKIKNALDDDAPIEPGLLVPNMTVYYRPRLLLDYIFESLSLTQQQIQKLRKEAPEVRYRSLSIQIDRSVRPTMQTRPPVVVPREEARDFDPDPAARWED